MPCICPIIKTNHLGSKLEAKEEIKTKKTQEEECRDMYDSIKAKQMSRDSHEIKTIIKKRESIQKLIAEIREANVGPHVVVDVIQQSPNNTR